MYVKRYDPSGAPLGFSQAVNGGGGYLGADATVVDVAYDDPTGMTELVGSASLDGTSLTGGVAVAAATATSRSWSGTTAWSRRIVQNGNCGLAPC